MNVVFDNGVCTSFQAEEAKVKISEVSGERVDNEAKLKVISQEEEAIKKEKEVWLICIQQTYITIMSPQKEEMRLHAVKLCSHDEI